MIRMGRVAISCLRVPYLTHIDESGKAERSNPESEHVLAALTMIELKLFKNGFRSEGYRLNIFPK